MRRKIDSERNISRVRCATSRSVQSGGRVYLWSEHAAAQRSDSWHACSDASGLSIAQAVKSLYVCFLPWVIASLLRRRQSAEYAHFQAFSTFTPALRLHLVFGTTLNFWNHAQFFSYALGSHPCTRTRRFEDRESADLQRYTAEGR